MLHAEDRISFDLHPSIAGARLQYLLGEYGFAVFTALRQVEIRVRELAGFPDDVFGIDLITRALKPDSGPLADMESPRAGREATMALFRGAIGLFKNPTSHRQVDFGDPLFAAEVVFLADLLLRILDRVEVLIAGSSSH